MWFSRLGVIRKANGCKLDSQSSRGVCKTQLTQCFSHTSMFLSLFSPLSNNKYIKSFKKRKKEILRLSFLMRGNNSFPQVKVWKKMLVSWSSCSSDAQSASAQPCGVKGGMACWPPCREPLGSQRTQPLTSPHRDTREKCK